MDGRWEDSMATKPVIAGADGSQESLRAVEWAAREAVLRATSLRIVAVPGLPPRMAATQATPGTVSDVVEKSTSQALAAAAEQAAAQQPGLAIDTELIAGAPTEVLVRAGQDASMLVLGSRGDGGFSALVLGSVSRYVATHAPVPVVVVREETRSGPPEIVVGVRDPAQSAAALGFGFEEAALRQAGLLAVHAWSSAVPGRTEAPAEETSRLESAVAAWREKFPEVEARWEVAHAHPGRALADSSARAELVVLGRHALGGPHTLGVRSVTHAVLGHAHGPVVSVPGD
jgi:nucleotide-binding universal stress UspA family protein